MTTNQNRTQFEAWYQKHFNHSQYLEWNDKGFYESPATGNLFAAFVAGVAVDVPVVDSQSAELLASLEREEQAELLMAEGFVRESGRASISALQRKFKIGYERACRLMAKLTDSGVLSTIDANGHRNVLPKAVKP